MTALHPEAAPLAFDALSAMVRADTLSPAAFQPALDTAFHFAERHSKVTSPTTIGFKPHTATRDFLGPVSYVVRHCGRLNITLPGCSASVHQ